MLIVVSVFDDKRGNLVINPGFALYGISIHFRIVMPIAAIISSSFLQGFAKYGSKVKATTMAQWMGNRYNSNHTFSSVLLLCY
jgi:5-methylthioribose kinase